MVGQVHRSLPRALGAGGLALAVAAVLAAPAGAYPTQSTVGLGTAGSFALLAGAGLTNTGVSTITGDIGSFPTATETGFGACPGAGNCAAITGTDHAGDAVTQGAKNDLITAYNDAAGRVSNEGSGALVLGNGQTLFSGVYTGPTSVAVQGDLTLDGGGNLDAVFIFQSGSSLDAATGSRVLLQNGAQACNVFWQVTSSATINTSAAFVGNILALTSISLKTGATLDGRALARNGATTLEGNTITRSACRTGSAVATPPATPPAAATAAVTAAETAAAAAKTAAGIAAANAAAAAAAAEVVKAAAVVKAAQDAAAAALVAKNAAAAAAAAAEAARQAALAADVEAARIKAAKAAKAARVARRAARKAAAARRRATAIARRHRLRGPRFTG